MTAQQQDEIFRIRPKITRVAAGGDGGNTGSLCSGSCTSRCRQVSARWACRRQRVSISCRTIAVNHCGSLPELRRTSYLQLQQLEEAIATNAKHLLKALCDKHPAVCTCSPFMDLSLKHMTYPCKKPVEPQVVNSQNSKIIQNMYFGIPWCILEAFPWLSSLPWCQRCFELSKSWMTKFTSQPETTWLAASIHRFKCFTAFSSKKTFNVLTSTIQSSQRTVLDSQIHNDGP